MSRERDHGGATKVYVGDLPPDATEREIEKEFTYYGRLKSVWVARNPPGFAFVEFEDSRDADDAIAGLDGKSICGSRVRVELSSGKKRPKPWERDGRGPPSGGMQESPAGDPQRRARYDDRDRGYGGRGGRGGRPGGRPFDPNDECYKCGGRGHYAYDCKEGGGGRRGGRDRSDSRDRGRWRSRSRSRSGGRDRRRSLSPRRGRSGSRD